MLLAADFGDVLFAPTTYLGAGIFTQAQDQYGFDTFGFESSHDLEEFQGYGPYELLNGVTGEKKTSVEKQLFKRIMDPDPGRFTQVWEQPLYHYDENGPNFTGYYRRISYKWTETKFKWNAGDTLPYVGAFGIGTLLAGLCPICGVGIEIASGATYFNDAIRDEYQLRVDYTTNGLQVCYKYQPRYEIDAVPPLKPK